MKTFVVIPSYNHEKYIEKAIKSALDNQSDKIIIVDDGSSDGSVQLLKNINNEKIKVYFQENCGAHIALNRAIETAHRQGADFISILNSDDHYQKNRLSKCAEFLIQNKKSVCTTAINIIDENDAQLDDSHPRAKWFAEIAKLPKNNPCASIGIANYPATTSNVFATAEYLVKNPFTNFRYCHDYYFLTKSALDDELCFLDEKLLNYRVHSTNTMNTPPHKLICEIQKMQAILAYNFHDQMLENKTKRENFYTLASAQWNNVSAFNSAFQIFLLYSLIKKKYSKKEIVDFFDSIDNKKFHELNRYPNSELVNKKSLIDKKRIAEDYKNLKQKNKSLRNKLDEATKINTFANSKWIALGRVINNKASKKLFQKNAPHSEIIKNSRWLQLGKKLGADY